MNAPELPHLPDLPNAGYATRRERELSDAIMMFMRGVERDRLMLLSIVLEGAAKWRKKGRAAMRELRPDDELLDAIYHYFELQACRPAMQQRLLAFANNPGIWRVLMREAWPDIEAQRETLRGLAKRGLVPRG